MTFLFGLFYFFFGCGYCERDEDNDDVSSGGYLLKLVFWPYYFGKDVRNIMETR